MSINVKANNTTHTIPEEYQYSTSESVYTGRKWIDGKKIYTTVMKGTLTQSNYTLPSCCKGLISTMIDMHAIWLDTGNNWRYIPIAHQDNVRDGVGINVLGRYGDNVYLARNAETGGGTLYIILEYTKTNE